MLKNVIRDLTPNTSWELEQQMMILKVLQNKIYTIYDTIISHVSSNKTMSHADITTVIETQFSKSLADYRQTLSILKTNKDFTLTSLSVVVNKLNII